MAEQRRSAPRAARQLLVHYRLGPDAPWRPATIKDVSRDGTRLVCEEPFEPGQSLEVRFGLPLFPRPVQIVGRVAWKKPIFSGRLRMDEYGLFFTSLDAEVRQALSGAVQRFLKQPSSP